MQLHNDDEIIITETPRVLEISCPFPGKGCIIRAPDLSCIRYMAHRLEIQNITLGTLGWIPEWILEVYMENCHILETTLPDKQPGSITNLPMSVIQLTCRGCQIPLSAYKQLVHHRLIRLELIDQGLTCVPAAVSEYASNLLFLNLSSNSLNEFSEWPSKIRGLLLAGNKLNELVHLGHLPPFLEDLDISNNLFVEIPTAVLPQHLRKLNIARNELHWLPEDPSEYPPNLRDLNISGNCGLDDLTDAAFPDMLTNLNAVECEISKLPHEWNCYCLTNLDVSDNNISNLGELPTGQVMNISYMGNPCWVDSPPESMSNSVQSSVIEDVADSDVFIDDSILADQESYVDSVFTSGHSSPTPYQQVIDTVYTGLIIISQRKDTAVIPILSPPLVGGEFNMNGTVDTGSLAQSLGTAVIPILSPPLVGGEFNMNGTQPIEPITHQPHKNDDCGIAEYKEAISRSSSNEELQKLTKKPSPSILNQNYGPSYHSNEPLINAIDYVVTSGFKRVGSFISAVSDILTLESNYESIETNSNASDASLVNINPVDGQVLEPLTSRG